MDSPAPTNRPKGNRWIPFVAVVQEDLRQTVRHWAFLLWAGLAAALPALWLFNPSPANPAADHAGFIPGSGKPLHVAAKPQQEEQPPNNEERAIPRAPRSRPAEPQPDAAEPTKQGEPAAATAPPTVARISASSLGGRLLSMHILIWSGLAIALGVCAIAAEAPLLGDAVLCWGVARWHYFVAKCLARGVAAAGMFLALTIPTLYIFGVRTVNDLTVVGAAWALAWAACMLGGVVVLGVSLGVWFKHTMTGISASVALIAGAGLAASLLGPAEYSPLVFCEQFPLLLRGMEPAVVSTLPKIVVVLAGATALVSSQRFVHTDF